MGALSEVAAGLRLEAFSHYRDYLQALYQAMKDRGEPYSYNQFSADLGLGVNNVSWLLVTGRRRLTRHNLNKVSAALALHKLEARCLRYLVRYNNAKVQGDKDRYFRLLMATRNAMTTSAVTRSQLVYLGKWYHPVIREMVGLGRFFSDARWIINRLYLRLLPREVKESLALLEELELIKYSHNLERHVLTAKQLGPDTEALRLGAEGFHKKMLAISQDALTKVPWQRREFNALSVAISEEQAVTLRAMIRDFCGQVMALDNDAKAPDQIYQVNIQMFPFTKPID